MVKTWLTVATAAAIISSASMAMAADEKSGNEKEKCYGVVATGKNDCAASGKHSCAGQNTMDRSGAEWLYLPKGTCERLAGGSLTPTE